MGRSPVPLKNLSSSAMRNPALHPPQLARILVPVLLAPAVLARAEEVVTDDDLVLARNPIILKSRVWMGDEYADVDGGGSRNKFILGAIYGFGLGGDADRDLGVGFELPVLSSNPEGGDSDTGIGDFKFRFGQVLIDQQGGWRAGWFGETEFDTAADDVQAIANQRTQMALGGGGSWSIREDLVLTSTLQYGWSADGGATNGHKSEWEAHLTASWKCADHVSLKLDYKAAVTAIGGAELFNTLEPGIGWNVGGKRDIGLFASCEIPFDDPGTNCVAKAGLIWFF